MAQITIESIDKDTFQVTVTDQTSTQHFVTVTDEYHNKLTQNSLNKEELLQKAFLFLLERESNTMILRQFNLPVIQRYFPEFESTV